MNTVFVNGLAVALVFLISSQTNADMYVLSGTMDVFQATTNPGNVGNGTGTIAGTYDDVTNSLNYTLTWENLTSAITNMHFHVGAPGETGGPDLNIPSPWNTPYTDSATLSAGEESNLLGGLWYVNIHTSNFPTGEIRGQVQASLIPEPASAALLAGLSGLLLLRRRRS